MKRERKPGYILERDGRLVTVAEWHLRFARKRKRRKSHYMRYWSRWEPRWQKTKSQATRAARREGKRMARQETP